ncbi:MAG: thioredoxin fold domain-containing protein [Nitrospirota bacterium]
MKKIVVCVCAFVIVLVNVSCAKPDYKKVANDFITSATPLKEFEIREVADTNSADWKAVIVYVKQGTAKMPVVFFISKDGKSVVPNSMIFVNNKPVFERRLEPELGRLDFRPAETDRIVYNPSGTKTIFMFTDPDCPYCKKAMEKIRSYTGEYRIVVKHFPLEQIHPEAKKKAISEQTEWLKKTGKGADALKEAQRIVEEDIMEAKRAGIQGVPTYVMEDGTLKQGLF